MNDGPVELGVLVGDERLDVFLTEAFLKFSRSYWQKKIQNAEVLVNGKSSSPSKKLNRLDNITGVSVKSKTGSGITPLAEKLEVFYEDESLLVIDKPSGLVVHPAAGHENDTLVNILIHHYPNWQSIFADQRIGLVHRLDKDTSGLMVIAKDPSTKQDLSHQFSQRTIFRAYHAVVRGLMQDNLTRTSYLTRDPRNRLRFCSHEKSGKFAHTDFYPLILNTRKNLSLVLCKLKTGRTHQIRVHAKDLGHPVLGDAIYTSNHRSVAPRLCLHAFRLGFIHPKRKSPMSFTSSWSGEMHSFFESIGFTFEQAERAAKKWNL